MSSAGGYYDDRNPLLKGTLSRWVYVIFFWILSYFHISRNTASNTKYTYIYRYIAMRTKQGSCFRQFVSRSNNDNDRRKVWHERFILLDCSTGGLISLMSNRSAGLLLFLNASASVRPSVPSRVQPVCVAEIESYNSFLRKSEPSRIPQRYSISFRASYKIRNWRGNFVYADRKFVEHGRVERGHYVDRGVLLTHVLREMQYQRFAYSYQY